MSDQDHDIPGEISVAERQICLEHTPLRTLYIQLSTFWETPMMVDDAGILSLPRTADHLLPTDMGMRSPGNGL